MTVVRHKGLVRQLRRLGLDEQEPPDRAGWQQLLESVSAAYEQSDADRYTMERSIAVSSQEMRALHDVLSHRARHDTLTGLPNRAALTETLHQTLSARRTGGQDAAVLFIDLDGFKQVNDSLGHAAGDELLIRATERIRSVLRPNDTVARLGGDEFVVLCPQVDSLDTAIAVARRIREQLETPFRLGNQDTMISASIGIAMTGHASSAEDMLANADLAMYQAKRCGKARILIFDEEMREGADRRLSMENDLRHALDLGGLELYYQPVVRLADRGTVGMEALIRWNRPGYGLLTPADFLPVAEDSQLIIAVDSWVIGEACRVAAGWPEHAWVSVNLSLKDFQHDLLIETVSTALQANRLQPRRLVLELTETTLMSSTKTIEANLAEIRALGVQLAIDDFGTGYSSIAYLRELPARTLKIDSTFSAGVADDPVSAAVTGAIVTMARAFGLTAVAEGVEREDQARRLVELGCEAGQGFLFGSPCPANQLGRYWRPPARLVDHIGS
jgi:diguanylate cyclase (GGDEF)-like protein